MRDFAEMVSRSLDYHIKDSLVDYKDAKIKVILDYVGKHTVNILTWLWRSLIVICTSLSYYSARPLDNGW